MNTNPESQFSDKKNSKLSIITITYNAGKVLEKTIQSVINQSFTDFEYLIIDGKSTDDTLAIVEKYRSHVSHFISEPDQGIYDAMNKGLQAAKGEYVWFMNAGDEIYEPETAEHIFAQNQEADILYGNAMYINEKGKELGLRDTITPHLLPENLTWKSFRLGMVVCHQAFIARKSIAPLYDLNHPYSADIDWEIRCLKNAEKIFHTHLTLCNYMTGGFSQKHLRKSLQDRFLILQKHYGFFLNLLAHGKIAWRKIFQPPNPQRGNITKN
ncbi:MAG: glycosyltransferase [Verrucomicrobia bacterium]|nr:glycosyltransferase [Cytophagales bacterium]